MVRTKQALSPDVLADVLERLDLPTRMVAAIAGAARAVIRDKQLLQVVAAVGSRIYSEDEPITDDGFGNLPDGPAARSSDESAGNRHSHQNADDGKLDNAESPYPMVYALAFLSGFEFTRREYHRRAIPEAVLRDTMTAFRECLEEYEEQHGVLGLGSNSWMLPFFRARIFQLGRMQFMMEPFPHPLLVYRRRGGADTVILYDGGRSVRSDGSVVFPAEPVAFQTALRFEPGLVTGHPVSSDGTIGRSPVTLRLDQWELVLGKGFSGLSVHVSAQGKLTPDLVQDAFDRSVSFFSHHFPEYPVHARFITSWLLDPQLKRILSPESNILRFQSVWLPFPIDNGSDEQFFKDVFPGSPSRWDAVPTETSLQRRMVQYVADGGAWHEAGGLIVPK